MSFTKPWQRDSLAEKIRFVDAIVEHTAYPADIQQHAYPELSLNTITNKIKCLLRNERQKQLYLAPFFSEYFSKFQGQTVQELQEFIMEWRSHLRQLEDDLEENNQVKKDMESLEDYVLEREMMLHDRLIQQHNDSSERLLDRFQNRQGELKRNLEAKSELRQRFRRACASPYSRQQTNKTPYMPRTTPATPSSYKTPTSHKQQHSSRIHNHDNTESVNHPATGLPRPLISTPEVSFSPEVSSSPLSTTIKRLAFETPSRGFNNGPLLKADKVESNQNPEIIHIPSRYDDEVDEEYFNPMDD